MLDCYLGVLLSGLYYTKNVVAFGKSVAGL